MILVKAKNEVLIPCNTFSLTEIKKLQGKEFYIEVKKDSRSIRQNNLMWLWLTIIGDHFGYTKTEMKELLFRHLKLTKEITNKKTGEVLIIPIKTSELNISDFYDVLVSIDNFAVSNGIVLPNPEEFLKP